MTRSRSSQPENQLSWWWRLLPVAAAGLVPLLIGLRVHSQGFNLMDDGLWLLGGRVLADGGQLYRDLFSIYGPARYLLLVPFLGVWGQSVLALAVLKAVLDGVAGSFGYWLARRLGARWWAWLVPVGVVALGPVYPRYLAALAFAALVMGVIPGGQPSRCGWLVGLGWAALAWFGLDMAAYGAVILLVGRLLGGDEVPQWRWPTLAGGLVIGLVPLLVVPLLGGYGGQAWWDTVVYPVTRFGGAMGSSWWHSFLASPQLREPFSGLNTGEVLPPVGPAHQWWRALAWRLLFGVVWLLPVVVAVVRRLKVGRLAPLVGLAVAGWSTLLGRGDLDHLRLVALAVVLLAAPLLAGLRRRPVQAVAVLVCLLILGPRLGEQLWLAGRTQRPSLQHWPRSTARISLGADRVEALEEVLTAMDWDGQSPVVTWPAQPGLAFLLGAPLATSQMTLLAAEVRSPQAVVMDLQTNQPQVVVLGRASGLVTGIRGTRNLAPVLYNYLRHRYVQDFHLVTPEAVFRVLHPWSAGPDSLATLPLERRLPAVSQFVRTGTTPVMGPGASAAQSVKVGDTDLSGLAVLVGSPGPWPQQISLQLDVVGTTAGRADRLLARINRQVTLTQQVQKVGLVLPAVRGSAGQTVILDLTGNAAGDSPFTLFWNQSEDGVDYYPEGQAFWNREPVGGDLFFAVY